MTSDDLDTRPPEIEAVLTALRDRPPTALTACPEWTAHDIAAHLAGVHEEVVRHLLGYAEGRPLTSTRGFEEREAPFRLLPPERLLAEVERGADATRREIAAVLADVPDAVLRWTGRPMRVESFRTHLRSEYAIHRWDLVGDDETSWALLGQLALLEHAVTAIGAGAICARGIAAGVTEGQPVTARVRTEGHPDLLVRTAPGTATLALVEPDRDATLEADQAARLLMLWGRTPQPATRPRPGGAASDGIWVRRLFAGY